MPVLIGTLIGSIIASYLVYSLLHWAVFKRVTPDRLISRFAAAAAAYPVSACLAGIGMSDGHGFTSSGFLTYLPSSVIVLAYALHLGSKDRREGGGAA